MSTKKQSDANAYMASIREAREISMDKLSPEQKKLLSFAEKSPSYSQLFIERNRSRPSRNE